MACNMFETDGQFWDVANLQEFAITKTGRRPKNYPPFTKLGWYALTYGGDLLAEGCATEVEAYEKGLAALKARKEKL